MLVRELGRFVGETRLESLPSGVAQAVKLRILDLITAGMAGFQIGTFRPLLEVIGGAPEATVWGLGGRCGLRDAALANSFMAHASYLDDGSRFTGGHPSSVVTPSALALAEMRRASGRDLITAVAVGYELFLRLGRALYPSVVVRGFQSTAVLGAVASAGACASLFRLDAEASKNALAIACNLGVGLKEALKSSASQPIQVARSCEAGVMSALLAKAGAAGADSIIENGLLKAFADQVDKAQITDGLGSRYRIDETYIKVHGGCRGNHAPVDVVGDLVAKHRIQAADIDRIRIKVDSVTLAADIHEPENGNQAQFSVPFAVAVSLVEGNASIFQYTDEKVQDSRVREMMGRIMVEADPSLDPGYPDKRAAHAELILRNGTRLTHFVENAKGEPEFPLTAEEIENKFFLLAGGVLGSAAEAVRDLVMTLETIDDVAPLAGKIVAQAPAMHGSTQRKARTSGAAR